MNYLSSRLQMEAVFALDSAERRAFFTHLQLVIQALHDIEWVDSGDYAPGEESAAIRACLGQGDVLEAAIEAAWVAYAALAREIEIAGQSATKS